MISSEVIPSILLFDVRDVRVWLFDVLLTGICGIVMNNFLVCIQDQIFAIIYWFLFESSFCPHSWITFSYFHLYSFCCVFMFSTWSPFFLFIFLLVLMCTILLLSVRDPYFSVKSETKWNTISMAGKRIGYTENSVYIACSI